jgi:uncharacterized lipoprotein YmbA
MKYALLALAGLALAACSTTVSEQSPLGTTTPAGSVRVQSVTGDAASGITQDVTSRVKGAIETELAKAPGGAQPADLHFTVKVFNVKSGAKRALIGAFAGANHITVAVTVTDPAGKTLAQFEVSRTSNPGGYGVLYDQEAGIIRAAAQAIVKELHKG